MQNRKWNIEADWGHILLATLLATTSLWYFFDARSASQSLYNLIMIGPCVTAIVILYVVTLILEIRIHITDADNTTQEQSLRDLLDPTSVRNAAMMVLLVVYVLVLNPFGFEIASFLFIGSSLILQGEYRFGRIMAFSIIFSAFATWLIKLLSLAPIPTMLM